MTKDLDAIDKLYLAKAVKAGLPREAMERKIGEWRRKAYQGSAFVQYLTHQPAKPIAQEQISHENLSCIKLEKRRRCTAVGKNS